MERRNFLGLTMGALLGGADGLRAQAPTPVLGFLNSAGPANYAFNAAAFREGLAEAGYVEGRNLAVEYRWANGDYTKLPGLAKELVDRGVKVIAATGDVASARAATGATATIPIVYTIGGDPVKFGFAKSLAKPGGNATGVTLFSSTLTAKRLEILRELVPQATLIALFMNPDNDNVDADVAAAQEAARALGRQTIIVNARGPGEFDAAFESLVRQRAGAVLLASDPMLLAQRQALAAAAVRHRVPVMYWTREFIEAGGLIAYGSGITWMYREAGVYVGKILAGAKAGDLPVIQPSKFAMIVNAKTARAMGIVLPASILQRADEIVE
jgi:putative ABC transport system substrate-binding protein